MKHPILIFFALTLLLFVYLIKSIIQGIKTKQVLRLCFKIMGTGVLTGFLYMWFVPIHVGWEGETPITKFRFQVFETELDHYGNPSPLQTALFEYRPNRYGWLYLGHKVGGWEEYFNLRDLQVWEEDHQRYNDIWRKFLSAIIRKNEVYIKSNSFSKIMCIDCIYPPENKQQIYAIDDLLSQNAFDRYAVLKDEVLSVDKMDNVLLFSFSLQALGGERYNDIFEFHWDSESQQYKFKSTYSAP